MAFTFVYIRRLISDKGQRRRKLNGLIMNPKQENILIIEGGSFIAHVMQGPLYMYSGTTGIIL